MYFIELIWYYINKASVNRLFIIIMDNIKEKNLEMVLTWKKNIIFKIRLDQKSVKALVHGFVS